MKTIILTLTSVQNTLAKALVVTVCLMLLVSYAFDSMFSLPHFCLSLVTFGFHTNITNTLLSVVYLSVQYTLQILTIAVLVVFAVKAVLAYAAKRRVVP